jgi:hypothetical protein
LSSSSLKVTVYFTVDLPGAVALLTLSAIYVAFGTTAVVTG